AAGNRPRHLVGPGAEVRLRPGQGRQGPVPPRQYRGAAGGRPARHHRRPGPRRPGRRGRPAAGAPAGGGEARADRHAVHRPGGRGRAAAGGAPGGAGRAGRRPGGKGGQGEGPVISRFFIDRPIFATVLSVVITLVGGLSLVSLPVAQYPRITPPGVVVSISYPGASARVVADSVAAPVEQQVNGVPGMLYMSSQMGNDGTYSLTVTFDIGVDLKTALVMVQNRVALAMPQLPTQVQNQGITIRKKTPDIL